MRTDTRFTVTTSQVRVENDWRNAEPQIAALVSPSRPRDVRLVELPAAVRDHYFKSKERSNSNGAS